jgi:hypothetical protein
MSPNHVVVDGTCRARGVALSAWDDAVASVLRGVVAEPGVGVGSMGLSASLITRTLGVTLTALKDGLRLVLSPVAVFPD